MKFVIINDTQGREIPVNPDTVCYMQYNQSLAVTQIVFGALAGGLHAVNTRTPLSSVRALLESGGVDLPVSRRTPRSAP